MRRSRSWSLVCVSLSACSCKAGAENNGGTPGERGAVEFTYQRSCLFGCALEQPLLSGTREQIEVSDAGDVAGAQVSSSDEAIAAFALQRACYCGRDDSTRRIDIDIDASCESPWRKHCDNRVLVQAGAGGEAQLELRDARAALLDRVTVIVRQADMGQFSATLPDQLGSRTATAFELHAGQTLDLALTLFDDRGRKLLAPVGVTWRIDDPEVAGLSGFLTGEQLELSAGLSVTLRGKEQGSTQIHVHVPGLSAEVELSVQP